MPRSKQTHCMRGHELAGFNVVWSTGNSGKPQRSCKTCRNIRYRFRYRHDDAFRQEEKEKSALTKRKQKQRGYIGGHKCSPC